MNAQDDRQGLWLFFVIAYVFSWVFWIPEALAAHGMALPAAWIRFLNSPFNVAAWGPFFAALLLTLLQQGGKGVVQLLKRGVDLRFKKVWLVTIVGFPLLLFGGAILLSILIGTRPLDLTVISNPPYALVALVVILLTAGPLQEEFGWRGYALPRLQARFNALTAAVILGFFWWLWHLPAVFVPGKFMADSLWLFVALSVVIVLTSILFTWVYNNTNGSVLATMLMHAAMNWSIWLLMPDMKMNLPTIGLIAVFLAVAVGIVLWRCGTGLKGRG